MNEFKRLWPLWLPLAIAITGLSALTYVTAQQAYRSSLDDPQVQMTRDAARLIIAGVDPAVFAPQGASVEVSESLAPWIAFYDAKGVPLASSGLLHGVIPKLPQGVLDTAGVRGEYAVTWQPESGVRQALVIVAYKNASTTGYVVAGRNMSEVESRIDQLGLLVLAGWLVTLVASLGALVLGARRG